MFYVVIFLYIHISAIFDVTFSTIKSYIIFLLTANIISLFHFTTINWLNIIRKKNRKVYVDFFYITHEFVYPMG